MLDKDDATPLHHAAYNGHLKCAKKLLDFNASVEMKDNEVFYFLFYYYYNKYIYWGKREREKERERGLWVCWIKMMPLLFIMLLIMDI